MYIQLKGFVDENVVKEILSQNHIIRNATFDVKVLIGYSNGMGIEGTGEYTTEPMTREMAIPKDTPDVIITYENFGEYQSGTVFNRLFFNKLFEIVTRELKK